MLWPKRRSFVDAIWVTLYDLHVPAARRRGLPPQGKYNGAQRIAYSAIVLMGAGSLLCGLGDLQAGAVELADHRAGRIRDGAMGTLLADDGLLRILSRARGAGSSRGMEQLSLDGERGRDTERRPTAHRRATGNPEDEPPRERMSEFDNERETEIMRGDAEMVRRESARRTRRSFLVGGIAAAAGYAAWRAVDQSAQVGRLQSALRRRHRLERRRESAQYFVSVDCRRRIR